MKKKHLIPFLLVFIGLLTLSFAPADSIKLRLKPQQGKTYNITSKATMMTTMKVQGQSMSMSQSLETRQSFTAKEVFNNKSVLETQIDAIKMSISQMGMKLEYDSEHPEKASPMLAGQTREFEKHINKPATITFDEMGKLIGDSLELSQLSNVIVELPEQDLTEGSKWDFTKTQTVNNVDLNVNMEYTVIAITKKSVDVSFTGTVDSKEVTGSYNGTASFNPQTGMVMNSSTKSNISMTVNEEGLSIPITVTGTTTIEMK